MAKETTTYTYDTLGNLVQEKCKNTTIDYQYNILNQLVSRTDKNDSVTFSYDKRGNRVAEVGKKATEAYVYDATNHLVEGDQLAGRQVRLHLQRPVCAGAEHPDHPCRAGV